MRTTQLRSCNKRYLAHFLFLNVLLAGAARAQEEGPADKNEIPSQQQVRELLSKGRFPWYDATDDGFKRMRLLPDPPAIEADLSWSGSLLSALGQAIVFLVFIGLLAAIVVFLMRNLGFFQNMFEPSGRSKVVSREVDRVAVLPRGLDLDTADPWNAAIEARRQGDLARAIILLFAHQLMLLDRKGLIRLGPGRTGRQLVRSLKDSEVRRHVEPTLQIFERVYYGHQQPDPARFEEAWSQAEALEPILAVRVEK